MERGSPLEPEAITDLLAELVRVPSVNPSLDPAEGTGEALIAETGRGWFTAHGVRAWLEEAAPGRPNLVAEIGQRASPTLVLCAHLDTVDTRGMTIPPFEPRVESGRLYGRGAYDMKCGAAAVMAALAELATEPLRGSVMAALVSDEEHASLGARHFVAHHRADACILTEPSEGRLVLAHKGFVWLELRTHGRAAHGSRFDLGKSAIGRMARIVAALERFDEEVLRKRESHPLLPPPSLHCSMIQGGSGLSTYAAECVAQVERRTVPGESEAQVVAEIRRVIADAGEAADVAVSLTRSPLACDPESPVARAVRAATGDVTGSAPEEVGVGYWMDAATFADAGIPAVDYGPTGAGAHEAVEWVDLESVVTTARVLAGAARRFLG
jgi:acetylornithine deacetylase/succinyl-diaminopimelate desuccinylase-like protein